MYIHLKPNEKCQEPESAKIPAFAVCTNYVGFRIHLVDYFRLNFVNVVRASAGNSI